MTDLRIGSLFSGSGMLDLAVESVLGGRTVWQVEQEPAACRVLARHWPDADRSCTDVRQARGLAPVDVIIGGFPCQDLSVAGARKGLIDGDRSALFFIMADIVKEQQPDLVVIENVPGLERWRGVVEEELAGYSCRWVRWSATSAGAPHLRRRVLVVATRGGPSLRDLDLVVTPREWARLQSEKQVNLWATPRASDSRSPGRRAHKPITGEPLTSQAALWPTPSARNPNDGEGLASWMARRDRLQSGGKGTLSPPLAVAVRAAHEGVDLWPTPAASDYRTAGPGQRRGQLGEAVGPPYRLAADWVECLMGWPVGWTRADGPSLREQAAAMLQAPQWPRGRPPRDHESPWPGYAWEPPRTRGGPPVRGRPARLRMCGNGVVPQAAAMALRAAIAEGVSE